MTGTLEHRLKALKTCYTVYPEVVEGRDYQNVELRVRHPCFDSSREKAEKVG